MSTRCQIGFYQGDRQNIEAPDALLYRDFDGYPNGEYGVLAVLLPWAVEFHKDRGLDDSEYAAARCLVAMVKATAPDGNLDYGISQGFHGDIEYLYAVSPESVRVFATSETMEGTRRFRKVSKNLLTTLERKFNAQQLPKL